MPTAMPKSTIVPEGAVDAALGAGLPSQTWHESHEERLTVGQRAADRLRNVMGSWAFVSGFLLFMLVWAAVSVLEAGWDPYPYILLNLFLSMLAGLQGAILLIAATRQDGISAALAQHDLDTDVTASAGIQALLEINRRQLEVILELQQTLRGAETARAGANEKDKS